MISLVVVMDLMAEGEEVLKRIRVPEQIVLVVRMAEVR